MKLITYYIVLSTIGDVVAAFVCLGILGLTAAGWFAAIQRPMWKDLSPEERAKAPQAVPVEASPAAREA